MLLLGIYCLFASAAKSKVWLYLQTFVVAGSLLNLAALAAVVLRYAFNYGSVFFFGETSLRLSGLMHNPNQYGGYLVVLLAIQLAAVAFAKPMFGRRWIDVANVVALFLGSIFTISRGSWLATLAGALAVPIASRAAGSKVPRHKQILAPASVAACVIVVLLVARSGGLWPALQRSPSLEITKDSPTIYFPRGTPTLSEYLRVASDPSGAADRLAITRTALQLYATSPSTLALGLGLGGFSEIAPTTNLKSNVIIHNSFLWALVELGPLGALCLAGIFYAALRRLWRAVRARADESAASAALFAGLIGVLAWCMSNDGAYQRHLWFLLGLTAATITTSKPTPAPRRPAAENL
ncbi:MAG: O-antigen ligase family protein [Candidatus Acidiferrales bacterium]